MRSLLTDVRGVVDLGMILMIGIAFAGLVVIAYIIWTVRDQLIPTYPSGGSDAAQAAWNASYNESTASVANITTGFDNAVNLILVAMTIFILAIAIAALLMLRGR